MPADAVGSRPSDERAVKRVLPSEEEGRLPTSSSDEDEGRPLTRPNDKEGRTLTSDRVSIPVGDSHLPGRLRRAQGEPRGAVVLCHPHPAFGGNMDVWLLPVLGEALAADGWTVLRFDFRSVRTGVRPGEHHEERADLAAAVNWLRTEGHATPHGRLVLAGWSFGALVALLYGLEDPAVTDWVGIAPAVAPLEQLPMAPVPTERVRAWKARRVVVAGRHDQFFPPESLGAVAPHETHLLDDADHFFFDRDREVAALLVAALARQTS